MLGPLMNVITFISCTFRNERECDMKLPCSILGLAVLSASLASCGGGGGSGLAPGTTTGAQDPITPALPASTATPASIAVPNLQDGVAFSFTGSLQRTDFYNYPASDPLPAGTVSAKVSQNVNVSSVANPFGSGTAFDYHNAENDAYALQTLPFTIDSFYQLNLATFPSPLLLLGSKTVDDQMNATSVQYTTPQIVDEIPEASGQSWTNNPASRMITNYANGNVTNRLTDSSGDYSEKDVYVNIGGQKYPQVNLAATTYSNGSAEIVLVFNEEGRTGYPYSSVTDTFTMSKPTSSGITLSESSLSVPVTGTPPPSPSPTQFGVAPQWFQLPLYTETNVDNGTMAIPASCNVPRAFGTTARQIVRKVQTVDSAFGSVDVTTTTRYDVSNFGAVCVQISDVNNAFYDFSLADFTNQTPNQFFVFATTTAQPLISTTISELLTLETAGLHPASRSQTTALKPVSSEMIALAEIAVRRESQRAREKRLEQELLQVRNALVRGGYLQ
jgi:hypothetical protein